MIEESFPFKRRELEDLKLAKSLLEKPSLTAKLTKVIGTPVEAGIKMLPKGWSDQVNKAVRTALFRALEAATRTMPSRQSQRSSEFLHKVMAGTAGGVGGAFGLPALMIELPISTTIMLRSIADIARSEGHPIDHPAVRMSCLEVFALSGRTSERPAESAYFAARTALCRAVSEAAAYLAEKGAAERTAPALLRLVTAISGRFGVVVSEQVAAKAVPVVGAAGGAVINVLFMGHFQEMARGHFIVKRLEKLYGEDTVRAAYERLAVRPEKL